MTILVLAIMLTAGQADVSYVATSGNARNSTLGADGQLDWHPSPFRFQLGGGFIRLRNEEVVSQRLSSTFRGEREITSHTSLYLEGRYFRDPAGSGIERQWSGDIGGQYRIVSLALVQTWEHDVDAPYHHFLGTRIGLRGQHHINDAVTMEGQVNYLEDLSDLHNWRAQSVLTLTAALSKVVAIKASHHWYYAERPEPGKQHMDATMLISLAVKWARPTP